MPNILVVEDDDSLRAILVYQLGRAGHQVTEAADGRRALHALQTSRRDLVVSDIRMPGLDGLGLLKEIQRLDPELPVVLITAHGSIQDAVAAVKAGAFDYLAKPVEQEMLLHAVNQALKVVALKQENRRLRANLEQKSPLAAILGHSQPIRDVRALIERAAPTSATVLITGESGTGKELAARAIHALSPRAERSFVAISCAALPAGLLESELFGHQKGAFTGATGDHPGKFRQAHEGTLFLDEIAELDLSLQAKLLRVLQERVVDPVGATRGIPVDVRLIAATNQELPRLIREGKFRADLYFRLNVITLALPPLRWRGDDILIFMNHFYRQTSGGNPVLEEEARRCLLEYAWPGNIRELMNVCQQLAILYPGQPVTAAMLPVELRQLSPGVSRPVKTAGSVTDAGGLWDLERDAILRALEASAGNQSAAARALRIPRHVLLYRLKKYGING